MTDSTIKSRSIKTSCLETRIQENASAQQTDFNAWIFKNISVKKGHRVLELCCGTGAQTLSFLKRVGKDGHVVALDISRQSLDSLNSKVPVSERSRLSLIESDLDFFDESLVSHKIPEHSFDMIFCSYGLYYSKDAGSVLSRLKNWLKPDGSIIVVGPFGPNNEPLFRLLSDCRVKISSYVRFTSQTFMPEVVIPWGYLNATSLSIKILENKIFWKSPENILSYWENTTFYNSRRKEAVQEKLIEHFLMNDFFVNSKWVMLVILKHD